MTGRSSSEVAPRTSPGRRTGARKQNEVFCWRVRATRVEGGAAQRWRGPEGAPCAVS